MVKRIIKYMVNGLAVIVLLIFCFLILGSRFTGLEIFTIYTGSMEPAIPVGSTVIVQPIQEYRYKVGDIIAFNTSTNSDIVVHRVIEVKNENSPISFHTAGDANESPDVNPIPVGNVVGKVFFIIPYWGYLSDFVGTKLGYVLLVILPAMILISLETRNIIRELAGTKNSVPDNRHVTSIVYDTTIPGATLDYLSWNETLQANTDIIFEVRASDTPFAEDDAKPAWTPVGQTSPVTSGLPSGRYIQWKAIVTSSDTTETPPLDEVILEFY
ncbi:MAG TPA: signal peptidase I [Dehalococcoidia bacterium]|nr:signal peptidase I [Dehalococcoidia bacterium]